MNTDAKILSKILDKQIQQHIKRSYATTEWDSSQVHKNGSTYTNQSTSYTRLTKEKSKKHMIISIDAGKAFDKVQLPLMIRALSNVDIQGTYLNIIKPFVQLGINLTKKVQDIC